MVCCAFTMKKIYLCAANSTLIDNINEKNNCNIVCDVTCGYEFV